MSTQNNTVNSRLVFENASQMLADAGLDVQASVLTQSDLILEQQLATGLTQYQFPVLNNQQGPSNTLFNTEIRLNQQDSFVASAWGAFLLKAATIVDATFIVHTYPNPVTFSGAGVAAALETIYNSYCKITCNNQVILPVWSLSRHRSVPQSQAIAADTGVYPGIAYDQIDLSSDGFYPMEPNVIFIGSKNYVIQVILPAALAAVDGTGTPSDRLRLHYRGVLAQNSTIIT
jgi:hypothetical protein